MMTRDEAAELRAARDVYVAALIRQTRFALAATYRVALANRGLILLSGGPDNKDELISALVLLAYPPRAQVEALHVLFHKPGEAWSACEHCHPHQGERCDCEIGLGMS